MEIEPDFYDKCASAMVAVVATFYLNLLHRSFVLNRPPLGNSNL